MCTPTVVPGTALGSLLANARFEPAAPLAVFAPACLRTRSTARLYIRCTSVSRRPSFAGVRERVRRTAMQHGGGAAPPPDACCRRSSRGTRRQPGATVFGSATPGGGAVRRAGGPRRCRGIVGGRACFGGVSTRASWASRRARANRLCAQTLAMGGGSPSSQQSPSHFVQPPGSLSKTRGFALHAASGREGAGWVRPEHGPPGAARWSTTGTRGRSRARRVRPRRARGHGHGALGGRRTRSTRRTGIRISATISCSTAARMQTQTRLRRTLPETPTPTRRVCRRRADARRRRHRRRRGDGRLQRGSPGRPQPLGQGAPAFSVFQSQSAPVASAGMTGLQLAHGADAVRHPGGERPAPSAAFQAYAQYGSPPHTRSASPLFAGARDVPAGRGGERRGARRRRLLRQRWPRVLLIKMGHTLREAARLFGRHVKRRGRASSCGRRARRPHGDGRHRLLRQRAARRPPGRRITTDQLLRFAGPAHAQRYRAEACGCTATRGVKLVRRPGRLRGRATPSTTRRTRPLDVTVFQEFWMTRDNNGRWAPVLPCGRTTRACTCDNAPDTVAAVKGPRVLLDRRGANELPDRGTRRPPADRGPRAAGRRVAPRRIAGSSLSSHDGVAGFRPGARAGAQGRLPSTTDPRDVLVLPRNPGMTHSANELDPPEEGSGLGVAPGARRHRGDSSPGRGGFARRPVSFRGASSSSSRRTSKPVRPGLTRRRRPRTTFAPTELRRCRAARAREALRALHAGADGPAGRQYKALFEGFQFRAWEWSRASSVLHLQGQWPVAEGALGTPGLRPDVPARRLRESRAAPSPQVHDSLYLSAAFS